jgi:hypothetical protein
MSNSAKGFFGFLVMFSLLFVILGYEGIARLERNHIPPFPHDGLVAYLGGLPMPPGGAILFFHSLPGRIVVWLLVFIMPVICGVMAFRFQWEFVAFFILFLWAGLCGAIGGSLWINARLFFGDGF